MPTGGYRDPVVADQGNPRGPDRALRLRPLRPDDQAAFLAGHAAMAAEGLSFGLGLEPGMRWSAYLETLAGHQAGVGLPAGWVPSTLLVAEVATSPRAPWKSRGSAGTGSTDTLRQSASAAGPRKVRWSYRYGMAHSHIVW